MKELRKLFTTETTRIYGGTREEKLRDVWEKKVPLTFSSDFDYWNDRMNDDKTGEWLTRCEMTIAFLDTWKAANIPARDILYAITING